MSYLQSLLDQKNPLEPHEVADLRKWLSVLESDCEIFGAAAEDVHRMNAIRARLKAES